MAEDSANSLGVEYTAEGLVVFYNLICSARGFTMPPHLVPVCYGLVDRRIQKFMLIIGPGSGKSTLLSEVWPPFELGHDPTMTIIGISAGEALMQGFQRSVMETVEWSQEYRALFPRVKPDKQAGWSTERGMFVTGREIGNPDASFQACGLDSKRLTGLHGRMLLLDDIHDSENSGSIEQCEKVVDRYYNTIIGRADPRGARFILAGRRWNEYDVYAHLMKTGEWVVLELPAERDGTRDLWVDVQIPDGLVCCYNDPDHPIGAATLAANSGKTAGKVKVPRRRLTEVSRAAETDSGEVAKVSRRRLVDA